MSRTVRRKNERWDYGWVLRDWDGRGAVDRHSWEGRRRIARYHSDAGTGGLYMDSAPRWYRRAQNKKVWRAEERAVRRWMSGIDIEIPSRIQVSNASWFW